MPRHVHQLLNLVLGESPDAWAALGFEVSTDEDGHRFVSIGSTAIVLDPAASGFVGWSLDGTSPAIEGLPTSEIATSAVPTSHPNGITAIDHVVISTGDPEHVTEVLESAGIDRRGGRSTDSYGAPMSQAFFWLGDVILELVGPGPEAPRDDRPAELFGLALVSEDLRSTIAFLGGLAGEPKPAVQPGRSIAGVRGREVGVGLPLAVMSPHPA